MSVYDGKPHCDLCNREMVQRTHNEDHEAERKALGDDMATALDAHQRKRKWGRIREELGPFGDSAQDMCGLMDVAGGVPDVDLWAGSSIREWWEEETDGSVMVDVIRRIGMTAQVTWIFSADEVRAAVRYEDFIEAAEECVSRGGRFHNVD